MLCMAMYGQSFPHFFPFLPFRHTRTTVAALAVEKTTRKLFSYLMFFDEHLMAIHFRFPYTMQIRLVYFKLCAATQHKILCTLLAWVKIIFFATYPTTCTSCSFQFIAAIFFSLLNHAPITMFVS